MMKKTDSEKRFSRGLENAQKRTSAAAWGRFNSRMAHIYDAPSRDVAVFETIFVPNKRRKGRYVTKIVGFERQSGYDHEETMAMECAHTAKGAKQGLTWRAAK